MPGYAHSNCKYLRIIKMHDYHESKTVLTINDNREFKAENVLFIHQSCHILQSLSLSSMHAVTTD